MNPPYINDLLICGYIRSIHDKYVIHDLYLIILLFYSLRDSTKEWNEIDFSNISEITDRKTRNKLYSLNKLLDEDMININKLKQLCWNGIPNNLRARIWRLLLGYAPKKLSRRQRKLEDKRNEYYHLRRQYFEQKDGHDKLSQHEKMILKIMRC